MSDPVDITFLRAGGTRLLVPDIDLSNPETEKAATKIQALFRGHTTRQNMKSGDTKEAVQDLEAEFNPNDQELCHAATKIQASFRGHMARKQAPSAAGGGSGKPEDDLSKELQKLDAKTDGCTKPEDNSHRTLEQDIADIDLKDPELRKAASKIQATFRKRTAATPQKAATTPKPEVAVESLTQKE